MFESRRAFLQKLLATAAALGLDPLQGVVTDGDEYHNARLALKLRRPPGWDFSSIADFAALRDRQVLVDLADDDEIHPLKDPGNLPVFLIEDPSARDGEFAPAIALYDEVLDGPIPADQARAHREVMLDGFSVSYRHVQVVREPELIQLQGTEGSWSHWSYLHELDDGTSYQLSVRSLLVFRETRVHTFHFVELPDSPRRPELTWTNFVGSISYEPARRDPTVRRDTRRIKRQIERTALAAEPHAVWNAFVDLCAMEEYAELSATQRLGHLVFWYDSEVQNGGHLQYFLNRGTGLLEETVAALGALGLGRHADLLGRAGAAWNATERHQPDSAEAYSSQALEGEFDEFDGAFHECEPTVVEGLERHLDAHQDEYVEVV